MIRQTFRALRLAAAFLQQWRTGGVPSHWLQESAQRFAEVFGLSVSVTGELPRSGLLVANHLGYMDIIALASVLPCRFVAKSDVADWPVFGAFARRAETIFVNRGKRSAVAAANLALAHSMEKSTGYCTVIFPEGTSSDGSRVLPFHSSLLQSADESQCPVTPLGIRYAMASADPGEVMAYHGEMTLVPHLWNLLRFRDLHITLHFGEPKILQQSRKVEAVRLQKEVAVLAGVAESVAIKIAEPAIFHLQSV